MVYYLVGSEFADLSLISIRPHSLCHIHSVSQLNFTSPASSGDGSDRTRKTTTTCLLVANPWGNFCPIPVELFPRKNKTMRRRDDDDDYWEMNITKDKRLLRCDMRHPFRRHSFIPRLVDGGMCGYAFLFSHPVKFDVLMGASSVAIRSCCGVRLPRETIEI